MNIQKKKPEKEVITLNITPKVYEQLSAQGFYFKWDRVEQAEGTKIKFIGRLFTPDGKEVKASSNRNFYYRITGIE